MQPTIEQILSPTTCSFRYKRFTIDNFPFAWHMHPEYELTFITHGHGNRFVGDHISEFAQGDLVLLGSNLPHTWHGQTAGGEECGSVVIQFTHDFMGQGFFDRPEFCDILQLLQQAETGLAFHGEQRFVFGQRMAAMEDAPPLKRLTALLDILHDLAAAAECTQLASAAYSAPAAARDQERVDAACRYINEHYLEGLTQTDVAAIVHMSPSAFSRWFRKLTGWNFIQYVHELRVGRACRLLVETDRPITDICFEAGFSNLSNFNRIFLKVKAHSPRLYRQRFKRGSV